MSNILREARKGKGLTQTTVAEAIGCDQGTISKYENGSASPTTDVAPKLAQLLGLQVVQVLYPDKPEIWGEPRGKQRRVA